MRCATLMPSPTTLTRSLMSLSMRTGPRCSPTRKESFWLYFCSSRSRSNCADSSASSGSPRKQMAAPSPVSSMMREEASTPPMALAISSLNKVLSATCWSTLRLE